MRAKEISERFKVLNTKLVGTSRQGDRQETILAHQADLLGSHGRQLAKQTARSIQHETKIVKMIECLDSRVEGLFQRVESHNASLEQFDEDLGEQARRLEKAEKPLLKFPPFPVYPRYHWGQEAIEAMEDLVTYGTSLVRVDPVSVKIDMAETERRAVANAFNVLRRFKSGQPGPRVPDRPTFHYHNDIPLPPHGPKSFLWRSPLVRGNFNPILRPLETLEKSRRARYAKIQRNFNPTERDIEILEKSNRERYAKIHTLKEEKRTLKVMNDNQASSIFTLQDRAKGLNDTVDAQAETIAKKGRSNDRLSKENTYLVNENGALTYQLKKAQEGIYVLKNEAKDLWRAGDMQRVIFELSEAKAEIAVHRGQKANQKGTIQRQAKHIEDLQGKFECLDKAYQRRYTQAEVRGKEIEGLQETVSHQNATVSQLKAYKNELVDRNGILVDFIAKVNDALPAANSANQILNQAMCKVREWVRSDS